MASRATSSRDRVLVIGAGLAGLSAAERLLDAGIHVTVVDSFPVAGGRVASFDVPTAVAGLEAGDVVEHGLHAWFQHYRAVFGLMRRAGIPKPPLAGHGVYLFDRDRGHFEVEGGPGAWLLGSLRLPEPLRGPRRQALEAFSRLIAKLDSALAEDEATDAMSATVLLTRAGVPRQALDHVFGPCLYSLTSLPLEELSALEMMRWMAAIIPDPRIRSLPGGGTAAMAAPIAEALASRGADFRFGVEVTRLGLGPDGRVSLSSERAPDRTGVRHVLVPGFEPAEPPRAEDYDAVICTLPPDRLLAVTRGDPTLAAHPAFRRIAELENVHPLTIRLWFEKPIPGAREHYILSRGTLFDVVRPTAEPHRYDGVRLIDALVEDIDRHLPELGYDVERFVAEPSGARRVEARILADLERMYPGCIKDNRVLRRYLHTREGIIACRPGVWRKRPPQHLGLSHLVLAGDWTRQPWGVCMEGAVRSGRLAAESLLAGRQIEAKRWAYSEIAHSVKTVFERR